MTVELLLSAESETALYENRTDWDDSSADDVIVGFRDLSAELGIKEWRCTKSESDFGTFYSLASKKRYASVGDITPEALAELNRVNQWLTERTSDFEPAISSLEVVSSVADEN